MKRNLVWLWLNPQWETRVGMPKCNQLVCPLLLATIVIAQTFFGYFDGYAAAQSPPVDTPTLRSIMLERKSDRPGVQERLDALIKSTQEAREVRESAAVQAPLPAPTQSPIHSSKKYAPAVESGQPAVGAEPDATAGSTGSATRSMSEIRERIRILQRLRRDQQMSDAFRQANPIPGGVTAPSLTPLGGDVTETTTESVAPPAPAMSAIDASLEAPEIEEPSDPGVKQAPSVSSQQILSQPVNTFALGESLYQTGNFEAALKAFKKVDVSGLSQSDRTWLDLLVALCQRKTGDFKTAEGTLREIANEESSDYPVKAAQWWLKHASASHETLTKLDELSDEFDSLLERANSHVNR